MMSKNKLTSGEKDTIRRSSEHPVITTANGKAESTEEATVFVNDLDVFVTVMLFEYPPAVLSLSLSCGEMGNSYKWKGEDSPSLMKDGKGEKVHV